MEEYTARQGLGTKMRLRCENHACSLNNSSNSFHTTPKMGRIYIINTLLVLGMRIIGCGRSSALKFCSIMNLASPLSRPCWAQKVASIAEAAKSMFWIFKDA